MKTRLNKSLAFTLSLLILLASLPLSMLAFALGTTYTIADIEGLYKTQGRTSVVDNTLTLDFSASGIEFNANCSGDVTVTFDSTIRTTGDAGGLYFSVFVDGVMQAEDLRIPSNNGWDWTTPTEYPFHITADGESTFTIASGLEAGDHTFAIYNQSESYDGLMAVKSITLDGTFLDPPTEKDMYIEIVGDSIAAGHGNISTGNGLKPLYEDATRGWGFQVAKALDADWSIVAHSGITATANMGWSGSGSVTMPKLYPKQRYFSDTTTDYDFSARTPDVILVSLGTNDVNSSVLTNSGKDISVVPDGIRDMLATFRAKNPTSKIIWLYGMMTDDADEYILDAVEGAGGAANGVYALQLPLNTSGGNGHPNLAAQTTYAETIVNFINTLPENDAYAATIGAVVGDKVFSGNISGLTTGSLPTNWQLGNTGDNTISWANSGTSASVKSVQTDAGGTTATAITVNGGWQSTTIGTKVINSENYLVRATVYNYALFSDGSGTDGYMQFFNNPKYTTLATVSNAVDPMRINSSLHSTANQITVGGSNYAMSDFSDTGTFGLYDKLELAIYSYDGYNHFFINDKLVAKKAKTDQGTEGDVIGFACYKMHIAITDFNVYALTPVGGEKGTGFDYADTLGLKVSDAIIDHDFSKLTALPSEWKHNGTNTMAYKTVTLDGSSKGVMHIQSIWNGNSEASIAIPADSYVIKTTMYAIPVQSGVGEFTVATRDYASDGTTLKALSSMSVAGYGRTASTPYKNTISFKGANSQTVDNPVTFSDSEPTALTVFIYCVDGVNYYVTEDGKLLAKINHAADAALAGENYFTLTTNFIGVYMTEFEVYELKTQAQLIADKYDAVISDTLINDNYTTLGNADRWQIVSNQGTIGYRTFTDEDNNVGGLMIKETAWASNNASTVQAQINASSYMATLKLMYDGTAGSNYQVGLVTIGADNRTGVIAGFKQRIELCGPNRTSNYPYSNGVSVVSGETRDDAQKILSMEVGQKNYLEVTIVNFDGMTHYYFDGVLYKSIAQAETFNPTNYFYLSVDYASVYFTDFTVYELAPPTVAYVDGADIRYADEWGNTIGSGTAGISFNMHFDKTHPYYVKAFTGNTAEYGVLIDLGDSKAPLNIDVNTAGVLNIPISDYNETADTISYAVKLVGLSAEQLDSYFTVRAYAKVGDTYYYSDAAAYSPAVEANTVYAESGDDVKAKLDIVFENSNRYRGEYAGMAELKLAPVFAENMVLQREQNITVYGTGYGFGSVTLGNQTRRISSTTDGNWAVSFDPMEASKTPVKFEVNLSGDKTEYTNVLIGDVYITSGQSNMEFTIGSTVHNETAAYSSQTLRFTQKGTGGWSEFDATSVQKLSAVSTLFAQQLEKALGGNVPIGIISTAVGASRVDDWTPAENCLCDTYFTAENPPHSDYNLYDKGHHDLYKKHIEPIEQLKVAGVLWYQGESNRGANEAKHYYTFFENMVNAWRDNFGRNTAGDELPFYTVQIMLYEKDGSTDGNGNPTDQYNIQIAQAEAAKRIPKVTVCTMLSLEDTLTNGWLDIHPTDKSKVADALSKAALETYYRDMGDYTGAALEYTGPLYDTVTVNGNTATVTFTHAGGLKTIDGVVQVTEFEVKTSAGWVTAASATIVDGKVVVTAAAGEAITGVRMAYHNRPTINLYNGSGLCASPFIWEE